MLYILKIKRKISPRIDVSCTPIVELLKRLYSSPTILVIKIAPQWLDFSKAMLLALWRGKACANPLLIWWPECTRPLFRDHAAPWEEAFGSRHDWGFRIKRCSNTSQVQVQVSNFRFCFCWGRISIRSPAHHVWTKSNSPRQKDCTCTYLSDVKANLSLHLSLEARDYVECSGMLGIRDSQTSDKCWPEILLRRACHQFSFSASNSYEKPCMISSSYRAWMTAGTSCNLTVQCNTSNTIDQGGIIQSDNVHVSNFSRRFQALFQ